MRTLAVVAFQIREQRIVESIQIIKQSVFPIVHELLLHGSVEALAQCSSLGVHLRTTRVSVTVFYTHTLQVFVELSLILAAVVRQYFLDASWKQEFPSQALGLLASSQPRMRSVQRLRRDCWRGGWPTPTQDDTSGTPVGAFPCLGAPSGEGAIPRRTRLLLGALLTSCSALRPPSWWRLRHAYKVLRLTVNAAMVASKPNLSQNIRASHLRSALVAMSLHTVCIGSYFTQPWNAVADVLYLHVGYLFVTRILSSMFLALYRGITYQNLQNDRYTFELTNNSL